MFMRNGINLFIYCKERVSWIRLTCVRIGGQRGKIILIFLKKKLQREFLIRIDFFLKLLVELYL